MKILAILKHFFWMFFEKLVRWWKKREKGIEDEKKAILRYRNPQRNSASRILKNALRQIQQ